MRKKFELEPLPQHVEKGGTATFTCSPPEALPEPAILWYHDHRLIENDGRRIIIDPKLRQITIFEVRPEDHGNYTCVAENVASRRSSNPAQLTVVQHGGWSHWSSWSRCVPDSDQPIQVEGKEDLCQLMGHQRRLRTCSNPEPRFGGQNCLGDEFETRTCTVSCDDAEALQYMSASLPTNKQGWSAWSAWSECSPAPECRRTRKRTCMLTDGSVGCSGLNSQSISCAPSQCAPQPLETTTHRPLIADTDGIFSFANHQWHPAETALLITIPLCGILLLVLLGLVAVWIKRRWKHRKQLNVVLASTDFVSGSRGGMKFLRATGSGGSSNNGAPFGYSEVPGSGSSTSGVSSTERMARNTEVFMDNYNAKSRLVYQGATITYQSPPLSTSPPGHCKVPASEPLSRRSPPRGTGVAPQSMANYQYPSQYICPKKSYMEQSGAGVPLIGCGSEVESPPSASTSPGTTTSLHHSQQNHNFHHQLHQTNGFVTPPPYTPPNLMTQNSIHSSDMVKSTTSNSDRLVWNHISGNNDSELVLPQPINSRLFVPSGFVSQQQMGEVYLTVLTQDCEDLYPKMEQNETILSPVVEWGVTFDHQPIADGYQTAVLSFPHSIVASTLNSWQLELKFLPLHGKQWEKIDCNDESRFHLSANRIFAFTKRTGRFVLTGKPKVGVEPKPAKRVALACFVPRHSIGQMKEKLNEVNVLVYALSDNGIDLAEAVRIEEELGLCLVHSETIEPDQSCLPDEMPVISLKPSVDNLTVEVCDVSTPWFLRGHSKQAIPQSHVWSATPRSLMHCSFSFSNQQPNNQQEATQPLKCKIQVEQSSSKTTLTIDCGAV